VARSKTFKNIPVLLKASIGCSSFDISVLIRRSIPLVLPPSVSIVEAMALIS